MYNFRIPLDIDMRDLLSTLYLQVLYTEAPYLINNVITRCGHYVCLFTFSLFVCLIDYCCVLFPFHESKLISEYKYPSFVISFSNIVNQKQ